MKNLEIELRAPLTKEDADRITSYLNERAEFVKDEERTNYIYDCADPCDRDIRVKETNGVTRLSLKIGDWASMHREEIEWDLGEGQTEKALRFLASVGLCEGQTTHITSRTWMYKGCELKVANWNEGKRRYFEGETEYPEGATEQQQQEADTQLHDIIDELGLRPFTKKEYEDFVHDLQTLSESFTVESPVKKRIDT